MVDWEAAGSCHSDLRSYVVIIFLGRLGMRQNILYCFVYNFLREYLPLVMRFPCLNTRDVC